MAVPMHNDGQWEVFDESLPLLGATYGRGQARMVALGLRDGGLLVWSPGTQSDAARASLGKWGTPRFLLAPNRFHNMGLTEWKAAYPEAQIVAHPSAHARLKKRVAAADVRGLDALTAALPEDTRLISPPMAKQGETWLSVDRGEMRALVVCDAMTNMQRVPWLMQVLGFRARLMTNPFFKRFFLADKPGYREWLSSQITQRRPNLFIPAHGEVMRGVEVATSLQHLAGTI